LPRHVLYPCGEKQKVKSKPLWLAFVFWVRLPRQEIT